MNAPFMSLVTKSVLQGYLTIKPMSCRKNNFYTKVQVDKVKIKTWNCNKTTQSDSLAFMVWFDDIWTYYQINRRSNQRSCSGGQILCTEGFALISVMCVNASKHDLRILTQSIHASLREELDEGRSWCRWCQVIPAEDLARKAIQKEESKWTQNVAPQLLQEWLMWLMRWVLPSSGVGVLGAVPFHHFGPQRKSKVEEQARVKEAKERKWNGHFSPGWLSLGSRGSLPCVWQQWKAAKTGNVNKESTNM